MTNVTLRRTVLASISAIIAAASLMAVFVWTIDAPFPVALALLVLSMSSVLIAWAFGAGAPMARVFRIARVGIAAIVGVLSLFPVSMVAERMDSPYFSGWGMAHSGSFILVIPVTSAIAYVALGLVPGSRRSVRR
jgi:hypothetical protein